MLLSIIFPITGYVVAFITTGIAVYYGRKIKPHEQKHHELEVIKVRNDFLEKRLKDVEDKYTTCMGNLDKRNTELALLEENVRQLTMKLVSCQDVEIELRAKNDDLQSQIINAQVVANLMRNQVLEISRRFGIPRSISQLDK